MNAEEILRLIGEAETPKAKLLLGLGYYLGSDDSRVAEAMWDETWAISSANGECCVDGCTEPAMHTRDWTLGSPSWGEITVEGVFCCRHLDNLSDHGQRPGDPLVDLKIAGEARVQ